jgi:hypothetical protein
LEGLKEMVKAMAKDIIGIHGKNGEHYCLECVPDDLYREVTLDSLITRGEVQKEDRRYFCDMCNKQITAQD